MLQSCPPIVRSSLAKTDQFLGGNCEDHLLIRSGLLVVIATIINIIAKIKVVILIAGINDHLNVSLLMTSTLQVSLL